MEAVKRPGRVSVPANGVLSFEADGQVWRMCASVNALCELESLVSDPEQISLLMSGGAANFTTIRAGFCAFLRDNHPDLTEAETGLLLDHLGIQAAGGKLAQALLVAFPTATNARPRKAARGKA